MALALAGRPACCLGGRKFDVSAESTGVSVQEGSALLCSGLARRPVPPEQTIGTRLQKLLFSEVSFRIKMLTGRSHRTIIYRKLPTKFS